MTSPLVPFPAGMDCPIFARSFAGKFFEHAVELRKRLKAAPERDFADWRINGSQLLLGFFETIAGNVINKLHPGDIFELFTEVGPIDANDIRDLGERNMLGEMLINEPPRRPNIFGLGLVTIVGNVSKLNLGSSVCVCYHIFS